MRLGTWPASCRMDPCTHTAPAGVRAHAARVATRELATSEARAIRKFGPAFPCVLGLDRQG